MAGGKIKGITVEIGGNTTALSKALTSVNSTIKTTETELKKVDKLLKLDPKNTELVAQKQKLLGDEITGVKDKLGTLKAAEADVQAQFAKGDISEAQYRDFQREVAATEAELRKLETAADDNTAKIKALGEGMEKAGEKMTNAGKQLSKISAGIVGIGAAAVSVGNDYESQMSRVSAITGATGDDLAKLDAQALQLGADTAFSATEAAEGMENLGSAGFTTTEIIAAMPGMLDLAASSGENLAAASDIAASTINGFGLEASDAAHVADVLAQNAAKTNAAVSDTGEAMKYVAPVAKNAGWSLESVTAAIGMMADSGIKGSQAGTTLRGAISRLQKPTAAMTAAMQEMGFTAYDSEGKMKPLAQQISELQTATADMSDEQRDNAIATIYGTEALSGMTILLDGGADKLKTLTTELENSDGAAAAMASTMQDNTAGSIEQMQGALETAAIKVQKSLAPSIKAAADKVAELADKFANLSPKTQTAIVKVAAIVAAIGPLLVVAGKMATGIGAIIKILPKLRVAIEGVGMALKFLAANPVVLAITAIIVAIVALVYVVVKYRDKIKAGIIKAVNFLTNTFKVAIDSLKKAFTVAGASIKAAFSTVVSFFKSVGAGIKAVFSSIGEWFKQKFTAAKNGIKSAFSTVVSFFKSVDAGIKKVFTAIPNWFKDKFEGAWTGIKNVFSGVGDFFGGIWDTIKEKLTSIGSAIGNAIGDAFKTVVNSIINFAEGTINKFIKAINSAIGLINDIPGVEIKKLSLLEIPRLATGAVLTRPRQVIAGEDGAEAIVPLEKNTGWMSVIADKLASRIPWQSALTASTSMTAQAISQSNAREEAAPDKAVMQFYIDGKLVAESTVPYANVINGTKVILSKRGVQTT